MRLLLRQLSDSLLPQLDEGSDSLALEDFATWDERRRWKLEQNHVQILGTVSRTEINIRCPRATSSAAILRAFVARAVESRTLAIAEVYRSVLRDMLASTN